MKQFRQSLYFAASISASIIFAKFSYSAPPASAVDVSPTTQDAIVQASTRTPEELMGSISSDQKNVNELLGGKDDTALKNAADRKAVAPKLIPAIQQMRADLDELLTVEPKYKGQVASMQPQLIAILSVLGDKDSSDKIQSMANSSDPSKAVAGRSEQFMERWLTADKTVSAQTPLIDDLEKLDKTHTDSIPLTMMTVQLSHGAASAELNQRMLTIASGEMHNRAASQIKQQLAVIKAANDKLAAAENKPLIISGSTPDGKAFTSADLKGKVVLVDFWATWCGPCKEELPRVKKMYSDYHDKGLAVLGVSNDFDVDALTGFTAKENMPWTELFDAGAAANNEWNPITLAQGITAIPAMYLIDKKGILRSVSARENMEDLIPKLLSE